MATERQLVANRSDARKSTGPKTQEGKAVVRFNALWRGYRAEMLVLPGEDGEEFRQLQEEVVKQYEPAVGMEMILVERIARLLWRLKRAPAIELGIYGTALARAGQTLATDADLLEGHADEERRASGDAQPEHRAGTSAAELYEEAMHAREQFQREHFSLVVLAESQAALATLGEYELQLEKHLARSLGLLETAQRVRLARQQEIQQEIQRQKTRGVGAIGGGGGSVAGGSGVAGSGKEGGMRRENPGFRGGRRDKAGAGFPGEALLRARLFGWRSSQMIIRVRDRCVRASGWMEQGG